MKKKQRMDFTPEETEWLLGAGFRCYYTTNNFLYELTDGVYGQFYIATSDDRQIERCFGFMSGKTRCVYAETPQEVYEKLKEMAITEER